MFDQSFLTLSFMDNGVEKTVNTLENNMKVLEFNIPAPSFNYEFNNIGNSIIPMLNGFSERTAKATVLFDAYDSSEYAQYRSLLFSLFPTNTPVYVTYSDMPGRRFKALVNPFEAEQLNNTHGKLIIEFKMLSPYLESISTTLDGTAFYFKEGIKYIHNTPKFNIYNESDVLIDPRNVNTPILIKFNGATDNLKIRNVTTGDIFEYKTPLLNTDTVTLNGVRYLKNDLFSMVKDSNFGVITLAKGVNTFELIGVNDFTISFDFRFYYL